jgi:hypothetical protein
MKKYMICAAAFLAVAFASLDASADFAMSSIAGTSTQITATGDVNRYEQCTAFTQATIVASISGATKAGDKFTVNLRCGTMKFPALVATASADGGSDVVSGLVVIPPGTSGILYLDVAPNTQAGMWAASQVMQ